MKSPGQIAADDRSYLYGDGLFETVRVRPDGSIRWLDDHIARIRKSGAALGFGAELVEEAVAALDELRGRKPGIWRVTVSRDANAAFGGTGGVTTRFREYQQPTRPNLGVARGFYLPDDLLAEHKTTSFLRSIEARRRANLAGSDDAVMVSAGGLVGEASCANLVAVVGGRALTPSIRGILPGVTRAGLLRLAAEFGDPIQVREISLDELRQADEIALQSAGVGVLAAASFEGRKLDDSWSRRAQEWLP
jgi:branched-subunit amino acid aminotransferase/4-amino-4-deoxychorismate lyase